MVSNAWRDVIYKGNDNYFLEGTSGEGGCRRWGARLEVRMWRFTGRGSAREHVDAPGGDVRRDDDTVVCQWSAGGEPGADGGDCDLDNPLQIGGDSLYGQFFQGTIDEVRIYNVALTAAQIQTDMNTPVPSGHATADGPGEPDRDRSGRNSDGIELDSFNGQFRGDRVSVGAPDPGTPILPRLHRWWERIISIPGWWDPRITVIASGRRMK